MMKKKLDVRTPDSPGCVAQAVSLPTPALSVANECQDLLRAAKTESAVKDEGSRSDSIEVLGDSGEGTEAELKEPESECRGIIGAVGPAECLRVPFQLVKTSYDALAKGEASVKVLSSAQEVCESFDNLEGRAQKIIICGEPGAGKSTLCQDIFQLLCNSCAKFNIILLLNSERQLVKKYSRDRIEVDSSDLEVFSDREDTLLILDDYQQKVDGIDNKISSGLSKVNVILSTQADSCPHIEETASDILVAYFEILFSDHQIDEYLDQYRRLKVAGFISEDKSKIDLLKLLDHSKLKKMLRCGLQSVGGGHMLSITEMGSKLTEFYNEVALRTKALTKQDLKGVVSSYLKLSMLTEIVEHNNEIEIGTSTALYEKFIDQNLDRITDVHTKQKVKIYLGQKALHLLKADRDDKFLEKTDTDLEQELVGAHILRNPLEFVHDTFKEYFGAYFISEQLKAHTPNADTRNIARTIREHKYNELFRNVWKFVAGLLYMHYMTPIKDHVPLLRFWHNIQIMPRDVIGWKHTALIIECLNECKADQNLNFLRQLTAKIYTALLESVSVSSTHHAKILNKALYVCSALIGTPYSLVSSLNGIIKKSSDRSSLFCASRLIMISMHKNIDWGVAKALLRHRSWIVRDPAYYYLLENLEELKSVVKTDEVIELLKAELLCPHTGKITNEERKGILGIEETVAKILVIVLDPPEFDTLSTKVHAKYSKILQHPKAYRDRICKVLASMLRNKDIKRLHDENNVDFDPSGDLSPFIADVRKGLSYFQEAERGSDLSVLEHREVVEHILLVLKVLPPSISKRQAEFFRDSTARILVSMVTRHRGLINGIIQSLYNTNSDKDYIWNRILQKFFVVLPDLEGKHCIHQTPHDNIILLEDKSLLGIEHFVQSRRFPEDVYDYHTKEYPLGYSRLLQILEPTKLHKAVQRGSIDEVISILTGLPQIQECAIELDGALDFSWEKVDINDQSNGAGDTPLILAIKGDKWEIAMVLIKRGANVDLCNLDGMSAVSILFERIKPISDSGSNIGMKLDYDSEPDIWVDSISDRSTGAKIEPTKEKSDESLTRDVEGEVDNEITPLEVLLEAIKCRRQINSVFIEQIVLAPIKELYLDRLFCAFTGCKSISDFMGEDVSDELDKIDELKVLRKELYKLYIEHTESKKVEHRQSITAREGHCLELLSIRAYFYFKLFLDEKFSRGHIYKTDLAKELSVIIEILNNLKISAIYHDLTKLEQAVKDRLIEAHAHNIISQLQDLKEVEGEEYSCPVGYSYGERSCPKGHRFYLAFKKISKETVLIRIDNRIQPEFLKKAPWYRVDEDRVPIIKSFLVGIVQIDERLKRYIENVLRIDSSITDYSPAEKSDEGSIKTAIKSLVALIKSSQKDKERIEGIISGVIEREASRTVDVDELAVVERIQKDIYIYADDPSVKKGALPEHVDSLRDIHTQENSENCILSGHIVGVLNRRGEGFYKFITEYEHSEIGAACADTSTLVAPAKVDEDVEKPITPPVPTLLDVAAGPGASSGLIYSDDSSSSEEQNDFGRGASLTKPMVGVWSWYYSEGMDRLLPLRLANRLADGSLKVEAAVTFDERNPSMTWTRLSTQVQAQSSALILTRSSSKVVMPVLYRSGVVADQPAHWLGLVLVRLGDGRIQITYLDPEDNPMPIALMTTLISALSMAGLRSQPLFVHAQMAPQSYRDNCGPELIEDLAQFVTGWRVAESAVVAFHSELLEARLWNEACYMVREIPSLTSLGISSQEAESTGALIVVTCPEEVHDAQDFTTSSLWQIQSNLYKANLVLKVTDTMIDAIRWHQHPTSEHAKALLIDALHMNAMLAGCNVISVATSVVLVAGTYNEAGFDAAIKQATVMAAYMALPALAFSGSPVAGIGFAAAMTCYTAYQVGSNGYLLYKENLDSDDSTQEYFSIVGDTVQEATI